MGQAILTTALGMTMICIIPLLIVTAIEAIKDRLKRRSE